MGVGIETVLNHFGLSALDQMREASKLGVRSGSMMLYAGLCGPICEELVFRGFILRRLQPLGTKLAIVVSAVLFACAHGNVIQTPFAFITGLLLGYIAVHYGIKWSIAAHIFNNLGLSIGLQLLMKGPSFTVFNGCTYPIKHCGLDLAGCSVWAKGVGMVASRTNSSG